MVARTEQEMKTVLLIFLLDIINDVRPWVWPSCDDVDCEVSDWSKWSACSKTCGNYGASKRKRVITKHKKCDGAACPRLDEIRPCNRKCCPVDCVINWGSWGPCIGCEQNGKKKSSPTVGEKAKCGGLCQIPQPRTKSCISSKCCPVECKMGNWGAWSSCNAQCEKQGTQIRRRSVITQPSCNGKPCGVLSENKVCNGACCARDCVFGQWSYWSTCSAPNHVCSVNGGTRTRSRPLVKSASCGGKCDVNKQTEKCTVKPLQCKLTQWSGWSSCQPSNGKCGSGTRTRSRSILNQAVCSQACGTLKNTGQCMHSCCPVDCVYNAWGAWSKCTNQCGNGIQTRKRTIKSQAVCNGVACQQNQQSQTKSCTDYHNVDCVLTSWSSWSTCDNGCGTGNSVSTRKVQTPNQCKGKVCGTLTRKKSCQSYRDKTDCQVNQWSSYGPCTEKCAVGVRVRHRNVTVQTICGGKMCPTLTVSISCGQPNGGCTHACNDGICSCRPGYDKIGLTSCVAKDCGKPAVNYCPKGEKERGACLYPTINCATTGTKYPARCPFSCPTGYTLTGSKFAVCQTDGTWLPSQTYCKRDNDPPTDINLSGSLTVPENVEGGYIVGKLTTIDANPDYFTYHLIGDGGCNCFSISNDSLKTLKAFNFENPQKKFLVTIQTIDNGIPHLNFTKTFQISITDVNEKPSDIILSHHFVEENSKENTIIGTLQTVDEDLGQKFKYTILGGSNIFKIQGNKLLTSKTNVNCLTTNQPNKCPINYEKTKAFNLMINAMDSGNPALDTDKQLTINVRDKNDPPYNIMLSSAEVVENAPPNTYIGTVTATEEDIGQFLTFTLSDDDNGNFYMDSKTGKLYKMKASDYESKLAHYIVVEVADNGIPQMKVKKNLTINVKDVNEPPVNVVFFPKKGLSIKNLTLMIPENIAQNTLLADITVNDRDAISSLDILLDNSYSDTFALTTRTTACTLNADLKSNTKSVCKTTLKLNKMLNFEQKDVYDLSLRVIDRSHSVMYNFQINVIDINDSPTDVNINEGKSIDVPENQAGLRVGKLTTIDEDIGQSFSYKIVSNGYGFFEIQNDYLSLKTYSKLNYEAENVFLLNISSTDNGQPAKSIIRQIQINVIDNNDAVSNVVLSKYTVTENTKPNTVIAKINITDEDNVSPNAKSHPCYSHAGNYLDNNGHDVIVGINKPIIDFESFQTFNYTITCIDQNMRSTWSFEIKVLDENEAPTSISISNATINENSPPPVLIGSLLTIDPDNANRKHQTFNYTLMNNRDKFIIKGNKLHCIQSLDHESTRSIDIDIKVQDSGKPAITFSDIITILVKDVNDQPSDIRLSQTVVEENSPQYTVIGNLTTIDSDVGQSYTYRLINDADGRFEIYGSQLRVAQSNTKCLNKGGVFCTLNYEVSPTHQITIVSTDNGYPPQTLSKNFTVNLHDINDSPRRISISNFTVRENEPAGTLIGRFSAIDEDKGQVMTFELIGGDMSHFEIEGLGYLKLKTNFSDFETKRRYKILVRVTDNGYDKLQHSEYITIELLDVNEAPIEIKITDEGSSIGFNTSNPHVGENTKFGTTVGTLYSYDGDASASLTFSLDDDSNGTFALKNGGANCQKSSLGKFKVACKQELMVNKLIDYETMDRHHIIVKVTDQGGLYTIQPFTIQVLDYNDAPTDILLDSKHSVRIPEGLKQAQPIGQIHTVDEDSGQQFNYEIVGNSMKKLFEVHQEVLYILDNVELDYETKNMFNLTIKSIDQSGAKSSKSITKTFTIYIDDVNEAPNQIILSSNSFNENSALGAVVANITVIDPDNVGSSRQSHKCSISQSSFSSLEISNHQLIVKEEGIDFEQTQNISITILCSDDGSPVMSLSQDVVLHVVDVNERPVDIILSSNEIVENKIQIIGDLRTDDHDNFDGTIKQTFVYEIVNSPYPAIFVIQNSTLFNLKPFDYETENVYHVTIRTTDDGIPSMSFTKGFLIKVLDVNESPSLIILSSKTVPENSGKGTTIGTLSAVDEDFTSDGSQQQHQFTLIENPQGLFRIEQMNQLEVAIDNHLCLKHGGTYCALNFEDNRYFVIKVQAKDNGSPPQKFETTFNIQLTDVNESPTNLRLSNSYLPENASIGHIVGQFSFKDEDLGQVYNVTLLDNNNGRFTIDNQFNLIKAKATNYETQKKHVIIAQVADDGRPSLSVNKTFSIYIQDINESPTSLHISDKDASSSYLMDQPRIDENLPRDTVVGTIEAIDQDTVSDLVFSLDDDGDEMFRLDKKVTCKNITNQNSSHTACSTKLLSNAVFDHENENLYNIIVRVADHAGLSHISAFNITITDKNDKPTNVTIDGEIFVIIQENIIDKKIGELETIDEDVRQQYLYELVDDADGRFTITKGSLGRSWLSTTSKIINYEESRNYSVVIKTTDNGLPPKSFQHQIDIQIIDINEAPSDIILKDDAIDENSPIDTVIGNITVNDPDNASKNTILQTHTCTLTGDAKSTFKLVNGSIVVNNNRLLDYEANHLLYIYVRCEDSGVPPLSLTKKLSIGIADVNEPPYDLRLTKTTISENVANGYVGTLRASDPDWLLQKFQYKLLNGTDFFHLDGNSLKTAKALDFENKNSYSIVIKVTDRGGLFHIQKFTIQVIDKNDPPFDLKCSGFSTPETSKSGTTLGYCTAADQDLLQTHYYKITKIIGLGYNSQTIATYPKRLFLIESTTGRVEQVLRKLDHEKFHSYILTIQVTDSGVPPLSFEKNVTLKVTNVNQPPTDIILDNTKVLESALVGDLVGRISVVDPDNKHSQVHGHTCFLESRDQDYKTSPLKINQNDELVVDKPDLINFEFMPLHNIRINCSEHIINGYKISREFRIDFINVNEAPEQIKLSPSSINEHNQVNDLVGIIQFQDPDNLNFPKDKISVSYFEAWGGPFKLVKPYSIVATQQLDFESIPSYNVKVTLTDDGSPPLSSTKNLTITVSDLNDAPSGIKVSTILISEATRPGSVVATFTAIDHDKGQAHTFNLLDDAGVFRLSGAKLILTQKLNFVVTKYVEIVLEVTDNGQPSLSLRKSIKFTVTDRNDPPNGILATAYPIPENTKTRFKIAEIKVLDNDVGQSYNCQCIGPNKDRIGTQTELSGNVTVFLNPGKQNLDFEILNEFSVKLRCFDSGIPKYSIDTDIKVTVTDVNEPPFLIHIDDLQTIEIPENMSPSYVGFVSCKDPDKDQVFTYSVVGSSSNYFKFLPNSAMLVTKNFSMNYEAPPGINTIDVQIKVTDSGTPPLSYTGILTVKASDVNEAPFNITMVEDDEIISEMTSVGSSVAVLQADDPEVPNQDLTFYIEPFSDTFAIKKSDSSNYRASIILTKDLDYDQQNIYHLDIKVEDSGKPVLSSSKRFAFNIQKYDPCTSSTRNCPDNQICTRVSKAQTICACKPGFEMNNGVCQEIDECKETCDNCESLEKRDQCKLGNAAPCGPCVNGGKCVDNHMNYTCQCASGYTGRNCYVNIDDCANSPCNNGTCIDGIDTYSCDCYDGYEGKYCVDEINECDSVPCFEQENQQCTDLVASYICHCKDSMTGTRCERRTCGNDNECNEKQICHSVDLTKEESGSTKYRCIDKANLAYLLFRSTFAPLFGVNVFSWKVRFEEFLRKEVKIPLAWIGSTNQAEVLMTDVAIYDYIDVRYRKKRNRREVDYNHTTSVSFYGVVNDQILTPDVLLYSINDTCEILYTECKHYNDQFKCKICKNVKVAIEKLKRPIVLSSVGDENDPLWLDIVPIVAIVLSVVLLAMLGVCIYRRRRRSKHDRLDDQSNKYSMSMGNSIEIMEGRSQTFNEDDFNRFSGEVNPMYGVDEDEVENVINTSFKSLNPDGTIRQSNKFRMFDNPLYGIDDGHTSSSTNEDTTTSVSENNMYRGFSNPTFQNPESEC